LYEFFRAVVVGLSDAPDFLASKRNPEKMAATGTLFSCKRDKGGSK
jgi:hypothetical protein